MSSRLFGGVIRTLGKQERQVTVKIFPDSSSTPSFTTQGDGISSVELTATGKFTVTFDSAYYSLAAAHATYSTSADNVDLYAQLGAVSNLGTTTEATAVIKLKTGATNTDAAAAAADNFISATFLFEESAA